MFSWEPKVSLGNIVTWAMIIFGAGASYMSLRSDVDNLQSGMAAVAAERTEQAEKINQWHQWRGAVDSKLDLILKKLNEQSSRP